MIPELGHLALILALGIAIVQATLPLLGSMHANHTWMMSARPLAYGQFTLLFIALICLISAFVQSDFSVLYVATNSNSLLPLLYKISAVWGAHEGSLLLWVVLMAGWGAAVALFSRAIPLIMVARVLAVQGMVAVGFLLFVLFTSNPFARLFPVPPEGRDLNPLLQDPGLAFHPPMLYMGYVGFSIAFAFAIAALISGKLDATWARWSRPWTLIAWLFLTLGIALGSWWAYYELGWGGWWFWDPVENASLMPWLIGTALLHSLAVTEKRAAFKNWTVLLAISAFSLSLLGTFLVRSGVLTSIHAFATDPARGAFILVFLAIVIGGSLTLYAWRAPTVMSGGQFSLLSRETALLMNNLLFSAFTIIVLFGTLAPLIYDAFGWGKISVGFPWFNTMFVALAPPLAIVIGISAVLRWKQDQWWPVIKRLWWALLLTGIITAVLLRTSDHTGLIVGITLAAWILFAHIASVYSRLRRDGVQWRIELRRDLAGKGRSYYGMIIAHIGLALFIIGVTIVSHFAIETDVRLSPGDSHTVAGYRFEFKGSQSFTGANYQGERGQFNVFNGERHVAELFPEKRAYLGGGMPMTEAAIDAGLTRDIYVALGEPLGDGDWSVRLYYKPAVRFIWLGTIFMAIGGLLAALDPRYRQRRLFTAPASTESSN